MADIDEMMYSCGLEILHPGGLEKTDEMARACKVGSDRKVLDVGSGKGVTACYLARKYHCEVVGIDMSERMVAYARELAKKRGVEDRVSFRKANAEDLPFEEESFEIVLAECTTTLLDKGKAFSEFLRVTKAGGCIGDLEMTWRKPPTVEFVDRVYEVWEGFRTMTLEEWKAFFESLGMIDVQAVDFSEMQDVEKAMWKGLGIKGALKMLGKLLCRPALCRAVAQYEKVFKEGRAFFGYGYVVGRRA